MKLCLFIIIDANSFKVCSIRLLLGIIVLSPYIKFQYIDDLVSHLVYFFKVISVGLYEILNCVTSSILFHMPEIRSRHMFCTGKPDLWVLHFDLDNDSLYCNIATINHDKDILVCFSNLSHLVTQDAEPVRCFWTNADKVTKQ